MARYYEESALIELIKNKQLIFEESTPVDEAIASQIDAVVEGIGELPTADVVPRAEVETLQADIRGWQVKSQYDEEHFTADIKALQAENATLIKRKEEFLQSYSVALARQILSEIREAYEKYGGAYGMIQKINELDQRFGVIDCTKCRHFVGCESCRTGQVCGEFERIEN